MSDVIAVHPTRRAALEHLATLYSADPILVELDWAEQRIVAAGALRWRARNELGGSDACVLAAARLMDPVPLSATEIAWLDDIVRAEPEHRSLSRDLGGRAWPMTAAVTSTRLRRLSRDLASLDRKLGDRIYSMCVVAMRDALRRAGVKATVRAKNRGKKAAALVQAGDLTPDVLRQLGVTADELLDRSFDSLGAEVERIIRESNRQRSRLALLMWDLDPDEWEEEFDDDPEADRRAALAAAILALGLLRRAKAALEKRVTSFSVFHAQDPDLDVSVVVPFAVVREALRVNDGAKVVNDIKAGPNKSPELDRGVTLIPPDEGAVEVLLRRVAETKARADEEALGGTRGDRGRGGEGRVGPVFLRHYTWVHAYFGAPAKPFPPHKDLDGVEFDDWSRGEVLAKDPGEFPYGRIVWAVDDHEDCTCYEVITYDLAD